MKRVASEDLEIGKVYDTSSRDHLRLKYLGVWFFPAENQEVKIFKPMDRESGRYFIYATHPTLGEVIPFPKARFRLVGDRLEITLVGLKLNHYF